jgi:Ca2+-binding RTX toxin-like protein
MNLRPASTTAPRRSRSRIAAAVAAGAVGALSIVGAVASPASADIASCTGATINVKAGQKVVYGTCGPDKIFVGGNDKVIVYAGDGDDQVYGGGGPVGSYVTVHGGRGDDTVSVDPSKQLLANGNEGDDRLLGGYQADYLQGNDGQDDLIGNVGANYLDGGAGYDFLDSRTWNGEYKPDTVIGGSGGDIAWYTAGDNLSGVEGPFPK